jgi:release factor glutamine methyltransferase
VSVGAVVDRLVAAGCVAADEEAARFVDAAPDPVTLERWVCRRERGEPPAWILGTTAFCGRAVRVDRGVYVPRPQTEELARRAAALLPRRGRAVDLCTGSGAIAVHLALEVPDATILGVDLDARAAQCARTNGVPVIVGDLAAPLRREATYDVVTAVPPYVPTGALPLLPADIQRYEPRRALDGGADGLTIVRRAVADAGRLLRPAGWLLVEVGGDQDEALAFDFARHGFGHVSPWRDADGDLRGVAARLSARDR